MENFDIKLQKATNAEFISREIFEYELLYIAQAANCFGTVVIMGPRQ